MMDFLGLFNRAGRASDDMARLTARLRELREMAGSPRSASFEARTSGGSIDNFDRAVNLIEREAKIRERSMSECVPWVDAAWTAVDIVSADLSDEDSQILAQHYLFGDSWQKCAASIGRTSRSTPQVRARAALDWLDSVAVVDISPDGHPSVRLLA